MLNESKKPKARLVSAKRVFVGLSGGVDSSVTAYLLKRQGFDVVGVHLRCWNRNGCSVADAEDARRVAERLDIPFYVLDLEKEYKEKVVDYMVSGYASGLTPNPDVMCNKEIKFGLFLDKTLEMGADYIATGHYVKNQKSKISSRGGSSFGGKNQKYNSKFKTIYKLFEAKDKNKDQSYFLWTLTQDQLKHCLFPIGDYLKSEVRAIAKRASFPTALKKDSQGLCFVGKVTLRDFLGESLPSQRGDILDTAGNILGEHEGIQFYTVGQRHIQISNLKSLPRRQTGQISNQKPRYVVEKDVKKNAIIVAEGSDNPALYKKEIELTNVNFITPFTSLISARGGQAHLPAFGGNGEIDVFVRIRYRQPLSPAIISKLNATTYKLVFENPQKFVAPGQSAVFYSQEKCMLGGGVIV